MKRGVILAALLLSGTTSAWASSPGQPLDCSEEKVQELETQGGP